MNAAVGENQITRGRHPGHPARFNREELVQRTFPLVDRLSLLAGQEAAAACVVGVARGEADGQAVQIIEQRAGKSGLSGTAGAFERHDERPPPHGAALRSVFPATVHPTWTLARALPVSLKVSVLWPEGRFGTFGQALMRFGLTIQLWPVGQY